MELTASNEACRGAVFAHSQRGKSAVSYKDWSKTEGEILCQDLNCGSYKKNLNQSSFIEQSDVPLTTSFKCTGVKKPKHIWDCEKQTENQTVSSQLFIECQGKNVFPKHCWQMIIESVVPQKPLTLGNHSLSLLL